MKINLSILRKIIKEELGLDKDDLAVATDVERMMNNGVPRQSSSPMIKSNYALDQADIFISRSVKYYDHNEKPTELPDTIESQQKLEELQGRTVALIVWPDIDMLVGYDYLGTADTSSSHGGDHVNPWDLDANNLQAVQAVMSPGSVITNAAFAKLAKLHGYNTTFLFDYE